MIYVEYGPAYLKVVGHAGAAPKGQDLVCAAASMLVGTLQRVIDRMVEEEMVTYAIGTVEAGNAMFLCERSDEALASFEVIQDGFQLLAEQYPAYVALEQVTWNGERIPRLRRDWGSWPEEESEPQNAPIVILRVSEESQVPT